jgi:hypothetical protein
MTKEDAEGIIRSICRGVQNISYGTHFWQRVEERVPGFTSLDALNVLKRGKIVSGPTWNEEHRNYRVRVRGDSDHGQVTIVLAIRILDDAFGVTIFPDERG